MTTELAHARRAIHRSRARLLVLLELESQEICYVGQLERATGVRADKIHAALNGSLPDYRIEDSLVPLGLVRPVRAPRGRAYAITRFGRRTARIVARERAAAATSRRARRAVSE